MQHLYQYFYFFEINYSLFIFLSPFSGTFCTAIRA